MGLHFGTTVSFLIALLSPIPGHFCQLCQLCIIQNIPKPEIKQMKKTMVKVFKECGLSIIIECNLKTVNFLDVTFDLTNNIYKPYRKANNNPSYVNKNSNHPHAF